MIAGLFYLLSFNLIAQTATFDSSAEIAPEVIIKSQESRIGTNLKKDAIIKTEVLSREELEHKQAQTLVDAVSEEMGITAGTSCANCGSKRVTINGMRGEHTTILMDGVPLHSTISSFYGLDAVPVGGIERIEISRGAGAALTSPEAIGGVINVKTLTPEKSGSTIRATYGTNADYTVPFAISNVSKNKKTKTIIAGQFSRQNRRDFDNNGVAENPQMENRSGFAKISQDINSKNRISFRAGLQNLDNIGGGFEGERPRFIQGNFEYTFLDNNTNNAFLGDPETLTDWVRIKRQEYVAQFTRFIGEDSSLEFTFAHANQRQDSIYNLHSFDYGNNDKIFFGSAKFDTFIGENHFITLGFEGKDQRMSSSSFRLYDDPNGSGLAKDDFRSSVYGLFLQDTWDIGEQVELSSAVRADLIRVNWLAKKDVDNEIDEVLVSPRLHLKISHNDLFTSRLSYGLGYRPPLSFFESQHGLNENGFEVNIDEIEKAHSYGYSLNFQNNGINATASSHRTSLKNMAYGDPDFVKDQPVSLLNYKGTLNVWVNDLALSYQATPNWTFASTFENYQYDDEYKLLQPNALIERRISLSSDYHWKNWEFVATANWIGSRNLADYGYDKHFTSVGQNEDGLDIPVGKKNLKAPSFLTLDLFASVKINKTFNVFAGVQNVFDYTQMKKGDSPLNFAQHGSRRDHFHLDNNHIWGPLIGRTASAGLNASF